MFEPWVEKYKPRRLREVVGQPQAVRAVLGWAESWKKGKPSKKGLLLYGPSGSGKTAVTEALAHELKWDLIQFNASDKRTFDIIERVAGVAATTGTLSAGTLGRRLVILDEADNIYAAADRGGYRAIAEVLKLAENPIVLIANDRRAIPAEIVDACLPVNFRRLPQATIVQALQRICQKEGIKAEPLGLNVLAENSKGDLRVAINDLQSMAVGKEKLGVKDLALYPRDLQSNVFQMLGQLMRSTSGREARELLWSLDMSPEDAIGWLSENVPLMLQEPADLVRVYEALSRADIYLARTRKRQAYGMWGYAGDMMTVGVAFSREGGLKFARFKPPSSGVLYRRTRAVRAIRDGVARKVAARCHTSSRVARKHFLPYLALIFKHDREAAAKLGGELELTDVEVSYLKSLAS